MTASQFCRRCGKAYGGIHGHGPSSCGPPVVTPLAAAEARIAELEAERPEYEEAAFWHAAMVAERARAEAAEARIKTLEQDSDAAWDECREEIRAAEAERDEATRIASNYHAHFTAAEAEVAQLREAVGVKNRDIDASEAENGELRAEVAALRERIANADAFLADPAGDPIDAINFARAALAAAPGGSE